MIIGLCLWLGTLSTFILSTDRVASVSQLRHLTYNLFTLLMNRHGRKSLSGGRLPLPVSDQSHTFDCGWIPTCRLDTRRLESRDQFWWKVVGFTSRWDYSPSQESNDEMINLHLEILCPLGNSQVSRKTGTQSFVTVFFDTHFND